jgi:hypothetical protein
MDGAHSLARRNGTQPFYGIFGRTGTTKSLSALGSPFQLAAADMLWACRTQDLGGIKLPVGSHPFTGKSGPPPEGRVTVAQHFQAQDKRCVGDSASPTPESVRVGRLPTHGALHWDRLEA